jgi:lipase
MGVVHFQGGRVNMDPSLLKIKIGDTAIEYLQYNGDGPTVMMLHATGFLPWLWHPIARKLAGEYRIIAPYFCDHRYAEPEDGGLSWMILAEDLCRFCEALDIGNPSLVGHSMGATVMAIANAVHGSPADRMVIIEPIFLPRDFYSVKIGVDEHPLASKSIKRRNNWENRKAAKEYLRTRAL